MEGSAEKKLATSLWKPLLDPRYYISSSAKLISCKKTSAIDSKELVFITLSSEVVGAEDTVAPRYPLCNQTET